MKNNVFNEKIISLIFIALILTVAFYDVVILNKTFKLSTAVSQSYAYGVYQEHNNRPPFTPVFQVDAAVLEEPVLEFVKNQLRQGTLPLWNPHQGCGYSLISMLEIGLFFPLHIAFYLLPNIWAWDILILMRFLLAGYFTYWLMRNLNYNKTCSLCSSIIFMLNGSFILLPFWTFNVDLLAPLLIITLDQLIRYSDRKRMVYLALVVGLTILAGHPEHVVLVNLFGLLFFTFRLFSRNFSHRRFKTLRYLGLAYVLGVGVSAAVLFPFLQDFYAQSWNGHPDSVGLLVEENFERILTIALPQFFQLTPLTKDWLPSGWSGGYLGAIPLALAFVSLFKKQEGALNYFFVIMFFLIIGKEYGLPIINWVGHIPVLNKVRFAFHTPALAALSVSLSAGMGLHVILSQPKAFIKGLIYSVMLFFIVVYHLFIIHSSEIPFYIPLKASVFAFGLLIGFQGILLAKDKMWFKKSTAGLFIVGLVFFELFCYIYRIKPNKYNSFPKVPYIEQIKKEKHPVRSYGYNANFYPNTATGYGIDDLGIFSGLISDRFVTFINNFVIYENFVNDLRPTTLRNVPLLEVQEFLDLLNLKYLIVSANSLIHDKIVETENLKKLQELSGITLYERKGVLPRAFVVHHAIFEPDQDNALKVIRSIRHRLGSTVVIEHPKIATIINQLPIENDSTSSSSVEIVKYKPNEVVIKVETLEPGFLILSDTYHPGWSAFKNGKKTKIYPANHLFRAVFLNKGLHEIQFKFRPFSFFIGLGVSILSAITLLFIICLKSENQE